jgi:hypothetical protein
MLVQLSTPTSIISSTRPSYIRTNVRPFGLFLVVCPTTKSDASFLDAQNSREDIEVVAESNGWIGFFFENEMAFGRFRAICNINRFRKFPGVLFDDWNSPIHASQR